MTPVDLDASAGVEVVIDTARGRRLSALVPSDAVGWVPQHFYVEMVDVIRHRTVVARTLPEAAALAALDRLERWRAPPPGRSCRLSSHPPGSTGTT